MATKSIPDPAQMIVQALLTVVSERGLERATVREVSSAAGVAIGTVQHYFPTKDDLLIGAFTEVVARIRSRVEAVPLGDDVAVDLRAVLTELLPIDSARRAEARVQLAFAARAAVSPTLGALQRDVLDDVRRSLTLALRRRWGPAQDERSATAAAATLALVDGLAMHAVSSGVDDPDALIRQLELILQSVVK